MRNLSLSAIHRSFILLCVLLSTAYACTMGNFNLIKLVYGLIGGTFFGLVLVNIEKLLGKSTLRALNLTIVGLFIGYLLGLGLTTLFDAAFDPSFMNEDTVRLVHLIFYVIATYLSVVSTYRAADEFYVSLPFIRLQQTSSQRKDIVLDSSVLSDPRTIDLAASGLMDQQLLLPRFLLRDLHDQIDSPDESVRTKARRTLEVVRKLETLPSLGLRYVDTDFPEIKDPLAKMVRLARFCDAYILTADMNRIQQSAIEGIRIINLHTLSSSLKPLMQMGEVLDIKVQRYGKEARQGVGYLDDGTMVVVNGGGDFIGDTIKAQVLSVKHTTSGRMIFCNAMAEGVRVDTIPAGIEVTSKPHRDFSTASTHRDYFLV